MSSKKKIVEAPAQPVPAPVAPRPAKEATPALVRRVSIVEWARVRNLSSGWLATLVLPGDRRSLRDWDRFYAQLLDSRV